MFPKPQSPVSMSVAAGHNIEKINIVNDPLFSVAITGKQTPVLSLMRKKL